MLTIKTQDLRCPALRSETVVGVDGKVRRFYRWNGRFCTRAFYEVTTRLLYLW